jgi:hypothetical protein
MYLTFLCVEDVSSREWGRPSASQISQGWGCMLYPCAPSCAPTQHWTSATCAPNDNPTAIVGAVVSP